MPTIARESLIFTGQKPGNSFARQKELQKTDRETVGRLVAVRTRGQQLFVQGFALGLHGIYQHELKHQPALAARSFAEATAATQALQAMLGALAGLQSYVLITPEQWNLGLDQAVQTPAAAVGQDPIAFLRQPSRPKTRDFAGYYTCAFDALFVDELRRATAPATADPALLRQLDSLAFVEAVFPDRFSRTRTRSLWAAALSRPPQFQPNLVWMRAVARYQVPGDTLRQRRNAVLLAVSAAIQDSARLGQLRLTPGLRAFVRQVDVQHNFAHDNFQVLFSDLAAALAHAGRVPEAFALAGLLDKWDATPTRLRAAEQVMLAGHSLRPGLADSFLLAYSERIRRTPRVTPLNAFALFYGRSYLRTPHADQLRDLVNRLAEEVDVPYLFCERAIGYSLTGQSHLAVREAPANLPERLRQVYFNNVLLSLAHLHAQSHLNGWHEYDHTLLSGPIPGTPDYVGPAY